MLKRNKKVKVLILGSQGYLGYPLSCYLSKHGYEVYGIDNFLKSKLLNDTGTDSVTLLTNRNQYGSFVEMDITNYELLEEQIRKISPDVIVNMAQIPSAPYSMIGANEAGLTQRNNVIGALNVLWAVKNVNPKIHIISIGTMGEYGTKNLDISEGPIEIEYKGRKEVIPFPKSPGSYYHVSKVQMADDFDFASRIWGINITEINQGVVYGSKIDEFEDGDNNAFYIDELWGTAVNRMTAQAIIGYPLTVYGKGEQTRGYININDSMQAIRLLIDSPAKNGEYRIINQLSEIFSVNEIAEMVKEEAKKLGLNVRTKHYKNPRIEAEEHYYNPECKKLVELGFKPRGLREVVASTIEHLLAYKYRIKQLKKTIAPKTNWK